MTKTRKRGPDEVTKDFTFLLKENVNPFKAMELLLFMALRRIKIMAKGMKTCL